MKKLPFKNRILISWGSWSIVHWKKALAIVLAITLIMIFGASRVEMQMTYYSILPQKNANVRDLKKIINTFPLGSAIIGVIDARDISNPLEAEKKVKATIDALELELGKSKYSQYIKRTMGKMDMSLFKDHGIMLSKSTDIKRLTDMYSNLQLVPLLHNLNNDFEKEYSGNGENLSDNEEMAVNQFKGLDTLVNLIDISASGKKISREDVDQALDSYLFGDSYMLSNDNRMGLIMIEPTFTMDDIALMSEGVTEIEAGVKKIASEYGINGGITGLTVVGRDEMATSGQGLAGSSIIAIILILGLMIFAFRMFSAPLISGIPLVTGIIWTIGLAGFIVHRLNIITAMYMIVLLGLGIDYAIHLLTAYIQEKEEGRNLHDAVISALTKSGSGIIVGALTSAAAFFMLSFSKTEMVSELGIIAGLGIISELFVMMLMIPPLLAFRNYRLVKKGKEDHPLFKRININANAASGLGKILVRRPVIIALIMVGITVLLSFYSGRVGIETNIMKMEAKGLESIKLQDEMVKEFGMAPDGLSIISNNIEDIKNISKKLEKLSSVKQVDSIGPYVVTQAELERRVPEIEIFRSNLARTDYSDNTVDTSGLLEELYRLEDNLIELSDMAYIGNMNKISSVLSKITGRNDDGDKIVKTSFDSLYTFLKNNTYNIKELQNLQKSVRLSLKKKLSRMASEQMVTLQMVPASIRDAYVSGDNKSFLVSIIPTQNPWKGDFRNIYTSQVATVTDKATGMVLAGDQLSTMAREDGVRSSIAAVIVIFIILLIDFRNLKLALLTMIPLAASFLELFGIMGLAGIKFDFVNIIAVPLLIGIGIDDAVHINHRYLLEGKGAMEHVISRTGTALLLTSVTTIIGFASFLPSPMRAMRSTGIVLALAMAIAFINSVLLHPSIIIIVAEKFNLNIKPWNDKNGNKTV